MLSIMLGPQGQGHRETRWSIGFAQRVRILCAQPCGEGPLLTDGSPAQVKKLRPERLKDSVKVTLTVALRGQMPVPIRTESELATWNCATSSNHLRFGGRRDMRAGKTGEGWKVDRAKQPAGGGSERLGPWGTEDERKQLSKTATELPSETMGPEDQVSILLPPLPLPCPPLI